MIYNVYKVELNAIPLQQYYKLKQYVNILEINIVNFQPTLFLVWIDWEGLQYLTSFYCCVFPSEICPCIACPQRHNRKWQSQQNEGLLPPEQVSSMDDITSTAVLVTAFKFWISPSHFLQVTMVPNTTSEAGSSQRPKQSVPTSDGDLTFPYSI